MPKSVLLGGFFFDEIFLFRRRKRKISNARFPQTENPPAVQRETVKMFLKKNATARSGKSIARSGNITPLFQKRLSYPCQGNDHTGRTEGEPPIPSPKGGQDRYGSNPAEFPLREEAPGKKNLDL